MYTSQIAWLTNYAFEYSWNQMKVKRINLFFSKKNETSCFADYYRDSESKSCLHTVECLIMLHTDGWVYYYKFYWYHDEKKIGIHVRFSYVLLIRIITVHYGGSRHLEKGSQIFWIKKIIFSKI